MKSEEYYEGMQAVRDSRTFDPGPCPYIGADQMRQAMDWAEGVLEQQQIEAEERNHSDSIED